MVDWRRGERSGRSWMMESLREIRLKSVRRDEEGGEEDEVKVSEVRRR